MSHGIAPAQFVGKVVKGYKIVKPIGILVNFKGAGKFSVVFKGERESDQLVVALKLIKIFDMKEPQQREKCLKEVQLL